MNVFFSGNIRWGEKSDDITFLTRWIVKACDTADAGFGNG